MEAKKKDLRNVNGDLFLMLVGLVALGLANQWVEYNKTDVSVQSVQITTSVALEE